VEAALAHALEVVRVVAILVQLMVIAREVV
jgi:hypothetical protein